MFEHELRPYINKRLLNLAQRSIRCFGDDLVMYLDLGGTKEVFPSDRSRFKGIVKSATGLCEVLSEPARVKAAREGLLRPDSVVFWFVWVTSTGETKAKVLVMKSSPQIEYTTKQIGLA